MLQLKDITLTYKENNQDFCILKDINISLMKEHCLAILGKSGCGKTSLLNIMAGICRPSYGEVFYQGKELKKPVSTISMIFQNYGLFPWKTVRENMLLPLQLKKKKINEIEFIELTERLGIEAQIDKYPGQLSGGQKQRVAIGRAILNESNLILMDEPFSALDPKTREDMQIHIKNLLSDKKMTSVLVTHSIDEALSWGDEIAIFDRNGRTIADVLNNRNTSKPEMKTMIMEYLMEV